MTAFTSSRLAYTVGSASLQENGSLSELLQGEILLTTQPYTAWGGAVTARLYLPIARTAVWQQLTNYPRWVEYLPALSRSEVLSSHTSDTQAPIKRLYQVASKNFLLFKAEVEIYLKAIETPQQRIQFCLEQGSFNDFSADLRLHDCETGTILTYTVQATPTIPVPSILIQQAIQLDLPANLRHLRQVLCQPV